MASTVAVRELSESEYEQWTSLVAASPDGSIYSTPEYLDALCSVTGARFRVLGVWLGDELCGGIALYEQAYWYGAQAAPRLLLYYHGPVLRRFDTKYPSERTARSLRILGALAGVLERHPVAGMTLKCRHTVTDVRPFLAGGWRCSPSYTYIVPIDDLGAQHGRVEQNLRRLIRRCESQGIQFTEDQEIDAFFDLHQATMQRKAGTLYLSRHALREYFVRLRHQDLCRLYHARLPNGEAIAGQLVLLGPSSVSHTVMAVTAEAHLKLGASAFLRWKAFEALAARGYAANDLTDAALNPVTHFKSQLGGNLELCHVLHRTARGAVRVAQRIDEARWKVRGLADRMIVRGSTNGAHRGAADADGR